MKKTFGAAAAAPLDVIMAEDDKARKRPRRRRRKKKQNLDLRTMLRKEKPNKFDIQNFVLKAPKPERRASKRTGKAQTGLYINGRTTLASLIRQIPGGTQPLAKFLKK